MDRSPCQTYIEMIRHFAAITLQRHNIMSKITQANGEKRPSTQPLRIPLDFEETLADMLKIKPPPDRSPDSGKKERKKPSKKSKAKP